MRHTIINLLAVSSLLVSIPAFSQTTGQQFGPSSANASSKAFKFIPASDPDIVYMGRVSRANPQSVAFTYPGVSMFANFTGSTIAMGVKPGSGYFMVMLDDHDPFKVVASETDSLILLSDNLPSGPHSLQVMYAQEGYEQMPAYRGLYIDSDASLSKVSLPERRIEFIGNSITCGYGVEAMGPDYGFNYDTENHYYTYAAVAARILKAQHLVVARSGIGIYKNYGGPRQGSIGMTMPDKYELTLFVDGPDYANGERWNHSLFTPQVVCVNLGTNDTSLDTYDVSLIRAGYVRFIRHLRSVYPDAKIVMLCGSMMSGKALADCSRALAEAISEVNDKNVCRFDFSPQNGSLSYGADWHPSVRQQRKMADELVPFLRNLTGWE